MKAEIIVTPKPSVFDPQGDTVRRAIHQLGMECVDSVRIGKHIELEISGKNVEKTREKLEQICRDLLSNPVIEDYILKLDDETKPASAAAKLKALIEKATESHEEEAEAVVPSKKEKKSKKKDKEKKKDKKKKKKDKGKKKNKREDQD
jgi:phosphoribosylformylglycinamidine synthase subunit PurS